MRVEFTIIYYRQEPKFGADGLSHVIVLEYRFPRCIIRDSHTAYSQDIATDIQYKAAPLCDVVTGYLFDFFKSMKRWKTLKARFFKDEA